MTTPDAAIASDATIAAEPPPFRAFTQPPPIVLAPPAKPTSACQQGPEPVENARVIAALDAELRTTGGWVLPLTTFGEDESFDRRNHPTPPGTILRGRAGE